jgi:hypothetical protein
MRAPISTPQIYKKQSAREGSMSLRGKRRATTAAKQELPPMAKLQVGVQILPNKPLWIRALRRHHKRGNNFTMAKLQVGVQILPNKPLWIRALRRHHKRGNNFTGE